MKKPKTKTYYLCVVANHWGRGKSVDEAKSQCRKAGGKVNQTDGFIISTWAVPAGTEVSDLPFVNEIGRTMYRPGSKNTSCVLHRDGKVKNLLA